MVSGARGAGEPDAFLKNGFGARGPGMGGAMTALADDVDGIFWNPAGLSRLEKRQISTMYSPNQLEVHRSYLGAAVPARKLVLGAAWYRLASNGIELTNATSVTGFDDLAQDAFFVSLAVPVRPWLRIGATAKHLRFAFASSKLAGWGGDFGAQSEYRWWKAGVLFQDAFRTELTGNSLSGGTVSEKVPRRIRAGLGFTWPEEEEDRPFGAGWNFPLRLTIGLDGRIPLQGEENLEAFPGLEAWLVDRVAIRAGWVNQIGPSWGAGLRFSWMRVDYAVLVDPELTSQHRFAASFFF